MAASIGIKCIPVNVSAEDLSRFVSVEPSRCAVLSRALSAPNMTETIISASAITATTPSTTATTSSNLEPATSPSQLLSKEYFMPKHASIIGHRGLGSNLGPKGFNTLDGYFAGSIRENTMLAFNTAAQHGADFVELDVQVTKDGVPVIWHDDFIHYQRMDSTEMTTTTIRDLSIAEFRQISYLSTVSPDKQIVLMRKFDKDSDEFRPWVCRQEDQLPTLEEVVRDLPLAIGINVELKFDDDHKINSLSEIEELKAKISSIMGCISLHSSPFRKIVLSSFSPDACIIASNINTNKVYPVMMLTDAGFHIYPDERRNSIEAAYKLAKDNSMFGVVTYSYILPDEALMESFGKEGLVFMSYGEKNNDDSFSVKQIEMGIHALIVDDVRGIHHSVSKHILTAVA
jgi:glycerophosphodiester phosphodiesterase